MTGSVLLAHPSAELYGSDRVLVETAVALLEQGRRVTVTVPGPGPLVAVLEQAGIDVVVHAAPVLRKADLSPVGLLSLARQCARSLPGMRRLVRERGTDLVVVNTLTLPGWLLVARLAGVATVCHVHEAEDALPRPVALLLAGQLLLARQVLVNSAAAAASLVAVLPRLQGRLRLLYNGVAGPPVPALAVRSALADELRLVLVGRLSPRKGSDVAVAAVAELRRRGIAARLDLVGDVFPGYEWYAEQLRAQVSGLGLTDQVRFTGFQADVWPHLAAADVVLVPSRAEPFGNVAVEASLARRPVVASAVQGLKEIVRSGTTGLLVPPDDPAALADAIAELAADWPRARAMTAAAHAAAGARFSQAAYAARLGELLRELVVRTGPAPTGPTPIGPVPAADGRTAA